MNIVLLKIIMNRSRIVRLSINDGKKYFDTNNLKYIIRDINNLDKYVKIITDKKAGRCLNDDGLKLVPYDMIKDDICEYYIDYINLLSSKMYNRDCCSIRISEDIDETQTFTCIQLLEFMGLENFIRLNKITFIKRVNKEYVSRFGKPSAINSNKEPEYMAMDRFWLVKYLIQLDKELYEKKKAEKAEKAEKANQKNN
jgi:hypothetical protein